MTLKFHGWPWKTIGHLFYATSSFVHHFIAIGKFKLELQSGHAQSGSNLTIFLAVWPWNLTDDLEKQQSTSPKQHQALCIISSSFVNSNLSYGPEKVKLGCDLCDLDLWPLTLTFCMDITFVIGNNSRKWWYDVGNIVKKVSQTDGQTDGRTDRAIHRAAWSQLKINNLTGQQCGSYCKCHDDIIKWKQFPCYWPFVRGIHRSTVNSPHKGQWRGALVFSLICAWMNIWVNNREAGDLRRYRAHYDVTVMFVRKLTAWYNKLTALYREKET